MNVMHLLAAGTNCNYEQAQILTDLILLDEKYPDNEAENKKICKEFPILKAVQILAISRSMSKNEALSTYKEIMDKSEE